MTPPIPGMGAWETFNCEPKEKNNQFGEHIAVYTAPDLENQGKLLEGWFLYIEIYLGDIL